MITIHLKRGRERALQNRHPWLFGGAIAQVEGQAQPGDVAEIVDATGRPWGRGYYNPHSQIAVRMLTWDPSEEIDEGFWRHRLEASIARRQGLPELAETNARRLVHAESDALPGLIVDQYGEWVVLQALTAGIERRKGLLAALLMELLFPRGVYERSDVDVRPREGLADVVGPLVGEAPPPLVRIVEQACCFDVDMLHGQKTGFYLDQRENRRRVARYCGGADVLNSFAYTGAFGALAGVAGARRITNLDSSAEALAAAEAHMALNGLAPEQIETLEGDAFHVLRTLRDQARRFDVIILDPPKFAFSQAQVQAAARGYKDINLQAMHLLRPGGVLATFSCSGAVDESLFQKILFGASLDAGRQVRILERLGQAADHPTDLAFPEGTYLKGFICRVE